MKAAFERKDFSDRLKLALRNAEYSSDSPTQLAREFNVRFSGNPVTVHAARKWLVGEAIPTQEKLRALASWLGVPAEWLRFGGDDMEMAGQATEAAAAAGSAERFATEDIKLISDLQRLDEHYRVIAREIIRMLVRISREK